MRWTTVIAPYRPKFQAQLVSSDPNGKFNCSAYTAAMAIDYATVGNTVITGKQVRAESNEPKPDPSSPGLNLPQITAVAKKHEVLFGDNTGKTFQVVINSLIERRAVLLQGDSDQLGTDFNHGFLGDHMLLVTELSPTLKSALIFNPLAKAGEIISTDNLRKYAEKFGAAIGLKNGGCSFSVTRSVPYVGSVVEQ